MLALFGPQGLWVQAGGQSLQDTPFLLLYGNVFFNLCVLVRSATDALENVSASRLAAARTLGATPWRAFWRITWPLLLPALRRGMAFAAATAVGEFAVTLFLSRPEWATLTTLIYQRLGRPGAANLDSALVLAERGITHIVVTHQGRLQGVLSERDLFQLQRLSLVSLARGIRHATSLEQL